MLGLIAKKVGMSRVFEEDKVVPVTVCEVEPGIVTQIKSKEKNGYDAIQVGFINSKDKHLTKPELGIFKKLQIPPKKSLKEFRVNNDKISYNIKNEIRLDIFNIGDIVDVCGVSKGRGFSGVMRRHNFSGGPAGHGSRFHRRPGSIGNKEFPGRVVKGKKMAGHYGDVKVTVKNLKVVYINEEKNIIGIKGAIPGSKGNYVTVIKKGK